MKLLAAMMIGMQLPLLLLGLSRHASLHSMLPDITILALWLVILIQANTISLKNKYIALLQKR